MSNNFAIDHGMKISFEHPPSNWLLAGTIVDEPIVCWDTDTKEIYALIAVRTSTHTITIDSRRVRSVTMTGYTRSYAYPSKDTSKSKLIRDGKDEA